MSEAHEALLALHMKHKAINKECVFCRLAITENQRDLYQHIAEQECDYKQALEAKVERYGELESAAKSFMEYHPKMEQHEHSLVEFMRREARLRHAVTALEVEQDG